MSVIVVVRVKAWGKGGGRRTLNECPKGLSAKLLPCKGMFNQASNVNGTGTQTTTKSSSSPLPVLPAKLRNRRDFDPSTVQYREYKY